jgi:hypothetical protein
MTDRIEYFATFSIRRALGFAMLGIGTVMIGLIYDPALSLRTGATLTAIVAAILAWKGQRAPACPYRHTEVWMLLDQRHGLPEEHAQQVIGRVLATTYQRHAALCCYAAVGMWGMSVFFRLMA